MKNNFLQTDLKKLFNHIENQLFEYWVKSINTNDFQNQELIKKHFQQCIYFEELPPDLLTQILNDLRLYNSVYFKYSFNQYNLIVKTPKGEFSIPFKWFSCFKDKIIKAYY